MDYLERFARSGDLVGLFWRLRSPFRLGPGCWSIPRRVSASLIRCARSGGLGGPPHDGIAVGAAGVGRAPEVGVSHDELGRLAEEQAALRRVATLVARGVPPTEVFATVASEAGRLLGTDLAYLGRYERDETVTTVAGWSRDGDPPLVGTRYPIEEGTLSALVWRTGRPARVDSYADAPGRAAAVARQFGVRSSVGCPITVQGRLWGLTTVGSRRPEPLAGDTEARVAGFTELVATAIANTQARAELAASRARIVRSADQTRRRIERDLHDGVPQRLVALGPDLGAPPGARP